MEKRSLMPIVVPIVVGIVAVLLVVLGGRWALISWMDRGMSPHEDADEAVRTATRMGLVLVDGDEIVYGEVTKGFTDSSAYLVVRTPSPERLTALLDRSGFPPPGAVDLAHGHLRPAGQHGPQPSPTLISSEISRSGKYLTAVWDPSRHPRTVHLSAVET